MMTSEERAIEGEKEIEPLEEAYRQAVRQLNESRDTARDPYDENRKSHYHGLLVSMCDRGREYFCKIDSVIAESELLGCQRSAFWAKNLACTAANTLDLIPSHFTRIRNDYRDFFGELGPEPSDDAFFAMESLVAIHHPDQAKKLLEEFKLARLPIGGFTNPPPLNSMYSKTDKYVMFGTAIFFVLVMLAIGVFMKTKDYNNVNILIFRTVLALTGGAFGAVFIPGLFEIEVAWKKATVKAAGASAFFAAIFFLNPPALVKNAVEPSKTGSTETGHNADDRTPPTERAAPSPISTPAEATVAPKTPWVSTSPQPVVRDVGDIKGDLLKPRATPPIR